jgi:uncharacterized RDD family membrane protein YckC
MNCPSCDEPLASGRGQCPSCGAMVAPPTEGALAPDTLSITPPARAKDEPLREIPGLKKKDKAAWKDEVRERVRHRRHRQGGSALPLFDEPASTPAPTPESPEPAQRVPDTAPVDMSSAAGTVPGRFDHDVEDLPLAPTVVATLDDEIARAVTLNTEPVFQRREPVDPGGTDDWSVDAREAPADVRPVERPAHPAERAQAAAIDGCVLVGISILVVYFASRAAHTTVLGLRPAWPYLLGYLAFLGLVYATYFTGTTGQTLGKIATGLRVVDRVGHPPGYLRSLGRAAVGAVGIATAFAGVVPVFFDPARRALHDRIFKTRVVKN